MPSSNTAKGSETDEKSENNFSSMVSCHHASFPPDGWIIESGALEHMTYDQNKFYDPKGVIAVPRITLPTGASDSISHVGDVNLYNS
uniref:Uncharacterized protein n=1 Tax=Chenopodium quinoa TaxID=63459 RepID=A0A803MLZ8_CHEQI